MCELCSDNEHERKMAQDGCHLAARQLRRMACYYENLADGRTKPHDHDAITAAKHDARFIAKRMVDEWL
jgi:hypothetical protein